MPNGEQKHTEREFEVGKDESWFANIKRTYDEFMDISLVAARRSQQEFDKLNNISLQALQNAVETANMVSKQAVRHSDLAIDRQWNVDEVAALVAKSAIFQDAIAGAVAAAVAQVLSEKK